MNRAPGVMFMYMTSKKLFSFPLLLSDPSPCSQAMFQNSSEIFSQKEQESVLSETNSLVLRKNIVIFS